MRIDSLGLVDSHSQAPRVTASSQLLKRQNPRPPTTQSLCPTDSEELPPRLINRRSRLIQLIPGRDIAYTGGDSMTSNPEDSNRGSCFMISFVTKNTRSILSAQGKFKSLIYRHVILFWLLVGWIHLLWEGGLRQAAIERSDGHYNI